MAVLARQPYDTDVTALSPCRLLLLDARQFRLVFDRRPEGLLAVLRLATGRLRQVTEQLVDNRALTVSARLAKALLRLTGLQSFGSNSPASLLFSQRELANMTGACREVVNKQLGTWRAAGWIRMSAGTVTSVHATALSNELEHNVGYKS